MRPIYATQKLPEYQQYCKKLCLVCSLLKWPALFGLPFVLFYAVIIPEIRTQPNFAQSNLFTCFFSSSAHCLIAVVSILHRPEILKFKIVLGSKQRIPTSEHFGSVLANVLTNAPEQEFSAFARSAQNDRPGSQI